MPYQMDDLATSIVLNTLTSQLAPDDRCENMTGVTEDTYWGSFDGQVACMAQDHLSPPTENCVYNRGLRPLERFDWRAGVWLLALIFEAKPAFLLSMCHVGIWIGDTK
jgi:hypothetical protein